MAEPLKVEGLVGLAPDHADTCTLEASCVTGFEPMAVEEIKVLNLISRVVFHKKKGQHIRYC